MSAQPIEAPLTRRQMREIERAQETRQLAAEATLKALSAPALSLITSPRPIISIPAPTSVPEVPARRHLSVAPPVLPQPVQPPAVPAVVTASPAPQRFGRQPFEVPPVPSPWETGDLDDIRAWVERARVGTRPYGTAHDLPFPVEVPHLMDFRIIWALSAGLGALGADRFYLRKYATGSLKLLTLGGCGIWWFADMLRAATGSATDRDGHPFDGDRDHRIMATAASLILAAGAAWVAVPAVSPLVSEASSRVLSGAPEGIRTAVAPAPVQPVWVPLTELAGDPAMNPSEVISVAGTAVRITYTMSDAGFLYFEPAGTDILVGGKSPIAIAEAIDSGSLELEVVPGDYQFFLQSHGAHWTAAVEQLVVPTEAP